jgi:hypothetical protein
VIAHHWAHLLLRRWRHRRRDRRSSSDGAPKGAKVIKGNVGTLRVTNALLPALKESKAGAIVNLCADYLQVIVRSGKATSVHPPV